MHPLPNTYIEWPRLLLSSTPRSLVCFPDSLSCSFASFASPLLVTLFVASTLAIRRFRLLTYMSSLDRHSRFDPHVYCFCIHLHTLLPIRNVGHDLSPSRPASFRVEGYPCYLQHICQERPPRHLSLVSRQVKQDGR
ncbi:hypothetical protein FA13DRAFT_1176592 [Coprinellus micaceus]|uniref:Uncharacterized protein n=1 Tax=Coprinellus micaceus TaxID=71717 RepID=A0A4Y7STT8_COPMI|nr:hypothetical protein FA13DRAFT_1176592 [Coprinellus micaceus]